MKIDIVYTWVDSSDSEWIAKRNNRLDELGQVPENATNKALFDDNDELKYSLRSVSKYMPWINKIFIVTDNQIPEWLNQNNTKIKIIDHQDIFLDKNDLPTFNSCSIETNLHHIPDLSEHFIYFNDDMFLGDYCSPEFFFTKEGLPKIFTSEIIAFPKKKLFDIDFRDENKRNIHQHQIVNTRKLIREKLNKSVYNNIRHGAKPLLKSKLFELEKIFEKELKETRSNFFRSINDIIFIYLFEYWALAFNNGKKKYLRSYNIEKTNKIKNSSASNFDFGFINLHEENLKLNLDKMRNFKPKNFCLNQTPETSYENIMILKQFLEDYFPEKSEFEI